MSDYTLNSFDGYILAVEEKRLLMKRDCSWGTEEMIVTIAENTKILDTENGYPLLAGNLKMGMPIRAYVGETMTMSLPPIVNGVMILCGISTDYSFPTYTAVKASNFEEDRIGMVVAIDGMEIYVDENGEMFYDASFDGVHFNKAGYKQWYEYLKTHTVKEDVR